MREVPSLVDLCVRMAIDNVRYLGDVGDLDDNLLDRILTHCSLEQLTHIENSTEGRDLSPVTDKIWKKFYRMEFGADHMNTVIERMRQRKKTFKWRQLFEAKVKEREEAMQKSGDRLKRRYEEEDAKKQSRQVQLCTKVPPSSRTRHFSGGLAASNVYNTKSSLMKKAKIEFINSREVKNLAAMKKVVHRSTSLSSGGKPVAASRLTSSSSSSKLMKPVRGKF